MQKKDRLHDQGVEFVIESDAPVVPSQNVRPSVSFR